MYKRQEGNSYFYVKGSTLQNKCGVDGIDLIFIFLNIDFFYIILYLKKTHCKSLAIFLKAGQTYICVN